MVNDSDTGSLNIWLDVASILILVRHGGLLFFWSAFLGSKANLLLPIKIHMVNDSDSRYINGCHGLLLFCPLYCCSMVDCLLFGLFCV